MKAGWAARALCIAVALGAAGCGRSDLLCVRYRAERHYWSAVREEIATRLRSQEPDSTDLLVLRAAYRSVGASVDLAVFPKGDRRADAIRRDVKHVLASAELDAGRVGLEASRLDLALESYESARALADEDSSLLKATDFFRIEALRDSRRDDEALAAMQSMLDQYQPVISRDGTEDPVMALPEAMVAIREQMGDKPGAERAIQDAEQYYRDQLNRDWPPEGEAGIRVRLVRLELEDRDWDAALGDLKRLQGLAQTTPSLSQHEPEIRYFEATIKAKRIETADPRGAAALLDAVVEQYPQSPFAARAAYDAGTMLEAHGLRDDALDRYRLISDRFGDNDDVAPEAAYRRALLEDLEGDWVRSKGLLEMIPVRYPESQAALDAPMAVVRHYQAGGESPAVQSALRKAVSTYQDLIANRPKSSFRGGYRWSLAQAQFQMGEWNAGLATIDAMALNDPGHPLTAQGLLQAAKVAEDHDQRDRAAKYLERYLALHPDSTRIDEVQKQLNRLQ
jgi:tetratricopeptide (TPR) repeat protein